MSVFSGNYGTADTTSYSTLPDWVKQGAFQNYNTANAITSAPAPVYPGPRVAPLTADQQTGFDMVRSSVGAAQPGYDAAMERATYGAGNMTPSDVNKWMNPFTDQVIGRTVDQIRRQGGMDLKDIGQQSNAYGGDRMGVAEGQSRRNTSNQISDAVASLLMSGWNNAVGIAQGERGRAMQGAPIMANIAGQGAQGQLRDAAALESIGQTQQQQTQQNYDTGFQDWMRQVQWPFQMLNYRQGALTGSPYETSNTTSAPMPMPDPFTQGLGTLSTLYGLFNG